MAGKEEKRTPPGNNPDDNFGPIDNPPLGNAADPTASVADEKAANRWSVRPEDRDKVPRIDELHTGGMPDHGRRGALGKTDPNLGQDAFGWCRRRRTTEEGCGVAPAM